MYYYYCCYIMLMYIYYVFNDYKSKQQTLNHKNKCDFLCDVPSRLSPCTQNMQFSKISSFFILFIFFFFCCNYNIHNNIDNKNIKSINKRIFDTWYNCAFQHCDKCNMICVNCNWSSVLSPSLQFNLPLFFSIKLACNVISLNINTQTMCIQINFIVYLISMVAISIESSVTRVRAIFFDNKSQSNIWWYNAIEMIFV